jgi:hypothetical protein
MGWDDWRGEAGDSPRAPTSKNQVLPLIHTDDTDKANSKSQTQPRMNADGRGSGTRLPELSKSPELKKQSQNTYHGDTEALRKAEPGVG